MPRLTLNPATTLKGLSYSVCTPTPSSLSYTKYLTIFDKLGDFTGKLPVVFCVHMCVHVYKCMFVYGCMCACMYLRVLASTSVVEPEEEVGCPALSLFSALLLE